MKSLPTISLMLALTSPVVPGLQGAERVVPPLVENDTACGPNLLGRIAMAAEASGFLVEDSQARTRMESKPGLDFTLPALMISPPKNGVAKTMTLPSHARVRPGQRLTLSFFLVAQYVEKGRETSVHLVINRRGQGAVAENTTTVTKPGWVPAAVTWQSNAVVSAEDITFEIQFITTGSLKVAFPRAFIIGP